MKIRGNASDFLFIIGNSFMIVIPLKKQHFKQLKRLEVQLIYHSIKLGKWNKVADIFDQIMGSDHCPVMLELEEVEA